MKPVVFLGPTLPASEAAAILDAEYLPPVAQGDLYRCALAIRLRSASSMATLKAFLPYGTRKSCVRSTAGSPSSARRVWEPCEPPNWTPSG